MRITALKISNFKAITDVELADLGDMVVVAGPNGCGKSCIYDAIRLLKSAYGGYQPNEWQSWFGEFQIAVNQSLDQWNGLLQKKALPLRISAQFVLSPDEIAYLRDRARQVLLDQIWREEAPEAAGWQSMSSLPLAANLRTHAPKVQARLEHELAPFVSALSHDSHTAELNFTPNVGATLEQSRVLEILFRTYDPGHLGVIDYHSATRNYAREQVGGVNLNIDAESARLRQHALYNSNVKYNNLKTEMASVYVRQLLARDAGVDTGKSDLIDTLKELFATFFPGKQFLGPRPTPDGRMSFPVLTPSGETHDIDDLSSGEKEVLYGYLRLRNSAPRDSILLIDEPELHLNPRLIRGLASFYHRNIGRALNNQLWLVTHSDTLIREAVGQTGFKVFHMQAPGTYENVKQAAPIQIARDFDRAVIDIVGDLAAYRPGAKVVVFEGGGDSDFDVRMTSTLFPKFQEAVNMLSGGSKRRVAELYKLLDAAKKQGAVQDKFFAITDRDNDGPAIPSATTVFAWDKYHIENYLLDSVFIHAALDDLNLLCPEISTAEKIEGALIECARQIVPDIVANELRATAFEALSGALDFGFDPKRTDVPAAIVEAVARSVKRVNESATGKLTISHLSKLATTVQTRACERRLRTA